MEEWENTVNSFWVDFHFDVYVKGANSKMPSSELATYLTGRYVSFHIMTLSFKEYLRFHDLSLDKQGLNIKKL